MLTEVKALVIRTLDLSEHDRLLTLFTEEHGKITAVANGSRTLKSRYLAAAQLFCYASFVLYKKGDRYWVREASLIESFFDLRADLTRTALASYVCDVAGDVVEENQVLAIIEAMKMETSITAPMKGEVKEVLINQGQSVKAGELLIVMEAQ